MVHTKDDKSRFRYLRELTAIYRFESERVAGPGSFRRDINDTLWSLDELMSAIEDPLVNRKNMDSLLKDMKAKRDLMVVKTLGSDEERYTTRLGETVRVLGHCYEYWHSGRPSVNAVRWVVEEKKVPGQSVPAHDFILRLTHELAKVIPRNEHRNLDAAIEDVIRGIAQHLVPEGSPWESARLSEFQFRSALETLTSQYGNSPQRTTQMLTAGVGSGKTIAFLIAVFASALESIKDDTAGSRTHILLYPRTALAQDQFDTIRNIAFRISPRLCVHFEHESFYKKEGRSVKAGLPLVYRSGSGPPSIIVTTLETLKRRLQNPDFVQGVQGRITRVVLDEIHLIQGLAGGQVIGLLQRLRAMNGDSQILWTGSSATVAAPESHAAKVFGVEKTQVGVVPPFDEELELYGIAHHVFLKPSPLVSMLGALVNATSLLVHSKRAGVHTRKSNVAQNPKTIGFADNLDMLGRWNADLRENERTESSRDRPHPSGEVQKDWSARQREIPYALRLYQPLARRAKTAAGGGKEPFGPVPKELIGQDPCALCYKGERMNQPVWCSEEDLHELGRFVYRCGTKTSDSVVRFNIGSRAFAGARYIDTLDACPYLQAGACLWFAEENFKAEAIPKTGKYEFECVARSRVYSSKTSDQGSEDDDLSSRVFTGSTRDLYGVPLREEGAWIPCDIVLSSPSLEVGIDLPNVKESVMFKSIRNVTSYRQKAGRAGRERGSDALNVTLVSESPIDAHYYRQPRKLTMLAQLDPIPLADRNPSVLRCTVYSAIWDYLALKGIMPDPVPDNGFRTLLQHCFNELSDNRRSAIRYVSSTIHGTALLDADEVGRAVDQARNQIGLLLTPTTGMFRSTAIACVADIVSGYLSRAGTTPMLSDDLGPMLQALQTYTGRYWDSRPFIPSIEIGLIPEFESLDLMARCGWETATLSPIIDKLRERATNLGQASVALNYLGDIVSSLEGVARTLAILKTRGLDPKIVHFFYQFADLYNFQRPKTHYLSFMLQDIGVFRLFQKESSFVTPKNLYSSPYEDEVTVEFDKQAMGKHEEKVPLREALFGLIPGSWTFRWGSIPFKSLVGPLDVRMGGEMIADHTRMSEKLVLVPLKMNVLSPVGRVGNTIDVYKPVKLKARQCWKYVVCSPNSGLVSDGDESRESADDREEDKSHSRVKVPRTFLSKWIDIEATRGVPVLCHRAEADNMFIEYDDSRLVGENARAAVKHPLMGGLLGSVDWHESLVATDFVFSAIRSYGRKRPGNARITYVRNGREMAFGRSFATRGVSMDLSPDTFAGAVKEIASMILAGNRIWLPTAIKALSASLSTGDSSNALSMNHFIIRDLLGVLLVSKYPDLDSLDGSALISQLKNLIGDEGRLKEAAKEYFTSRSNLGLLPQGEEEPEEKPQTEDISVRVSDIVSTANRLLPLLSELEKDVRKWLERWLTESLLNTFGTAALTALMKLSGVTEQEVGYTIDLEGFNEGRYRVYLFDNDQHGNGSCQTLREYFHILHVQRYADFEAGKLLPTYDYATLLEEELMQCPEFLQDMNALAMAESAASLGQPTGLVELAHFDDLSREVLVTSKDVWGRVGIHGREDAWKLPLIQAIAGYVAKCEHLETDDVLRATGICWNGCPECTDTRGGALGGTGGDWFVDKAVLDFWFRFGTRNTKEYKNVPLADLRGNVGVIDIGAISRFGIKSSLSNAILRSVSLPYTIGLEIDRRSPMAPPTVLIRDNDILGLSVGSNRPRTSWHGIPAQGFRRMMWHNLLTTAFLDCMGILSDKEKEIWVVYFDIRDLDFTDVGMSGGAMTVLEHHRKRRSGQPPIESLSDILCWLAKRNFRITVCTDKMQTEKDTNPRGWKRVQSLLCLLSRQPNTRVLVKHFPVGIMHKKGLMSPIGALSGSANLTHSGATWNEESLSYFLPADDGYQDIRTNLHDTIASATSWSCPDSPGDQPSEHAGQSARRRRKT